MADVMKLTPDMIEAADRYIKNVALNGEYVLPAMFNWHEMWSAMLAASPPAREEAPAEGAGALDRAALTHIAQSMNSVLSGSWDAEQDCDWESKASETKLDRLDDLLGDLLTALRNRTSEPEAGAVAWSDFKPGSYPPLNGEWFVAKCPQAVRVVHYADKGDRLPIDHTGWAWPSLPTHWMRLRDYTHPAPATADKLKVAVEALENAREDMIGWFEAIDGEIRVENEMHVTLKDDLAKIDQALSTLNAQPS